MMAYWASKSIARGDWLDGLFELAEWCVAGEVHEADHCVRRMNELLMLAPEPEFLEGTRLLRPSQLETLLKAEAHDAAAMAMVGCGTAFMLSRASDGESLATVVLAGGLSEKSGAGASPALALIGALALSLSSAASSTRSMGRAANDQARSALH
ncbi:hypothetical protein [Novosphingobium sp. M1R2S20]|uniref:Uncharacterized protein n=1 Tax=Novosphingobium rhizovicinum TaxID=3228928 RepID=A0ABV3R8A9_9SPHN